MQFTERNAVIQDDEEWLNIPPLLRKLLRGLNEENEHNRALTEALRQEQRDTNLLLRRLIQKQTDMELDFARSNLLLATKLHLIKGDTEEGENDEEAAHRAAQKKLDRTAERLKSLEHKVKGFIQSQPEASEREASQQRVQNLEEKLAAAQTETERRMQEMTRASHEKVAALEETLAATRREVSAQGERCGQLSSQLLQTAEHVRALKTTCAAARVNVDEAREEAASREAAVEKRHLLFDRRFAALQRAMESVHSFLEEEKHAAANAVTAALKECKKDIETARDQQRLEMQKALLEARQHVSDLEHRCGRDRRDREDQMHALSTQQAQISSRMDQEMVPEITDLARKHERILGRVSLLEDEFSELREAAAKRQKEAALLAESCAAEKKAVAESIAAVQEQVQLLGSLVNDARTVSAGEHDGLSKEMEALRGSVRDCVAWRDHTDTQVRKVCEVVQDLSNAAHGTEKRLQHLATSMENEVQEVKRSVSQAVETAQPVGALRSAVEEATKLIRDESATTREALRGLTSQQDATALRTAQLERKLADLALSVDCVKQQPAPVATLPSWAEQPLREVSSVLIELESVRRRVAAVEAQRVVAHGEKQGETERREELQLQLTDSVEDTRRRLLELSRRVYSQEQQVASLSRRQDLHKGSHADEHESTSAMVRRLAGDVTSVLEKLFVTEQTVAAAREETEGRFAAVREQLDKATKDAALREAAAVKKDILDLCAAREQRTAAERAEREAHLLDTVAELQQQWTQLDLEGMIRRTVSEEMKRFRSELQPIQPQPQPLLQTDDKQILTAQAEHLRELQDALAAQAERVDALSHDVSAMQEKPVPPAAEPGGREARAAGEREAAATCTALADLHSQLTEHATLLQTQATTLRGVVEQTIPEMRAGLHARMADTEQRLDRSDDAGTQQLADFAARVAALDGRLTNLEEGAQAREKDRQAAGPAVVADVQEALRVLAEQVAQQRADYQQHLLQHDEVPVKPRKEAPPEEACCADVRPQLVALEADLKQYAYPRAELEERLENMWMAVVDLLARKQDAEEVEQKLEQLRRLMQEDTRVRLKHLRADLEAILEEKVGLHELQEILERQPADSGSSHDDDGDL